MSVEPDIIEYRGSHSEDDLDLFGPYRHLVRVVVEGRTFHVPEGNVVLRACQYIEMYTRSVRMPWRDYCWNDTDGCCEMTYKEEADAPEKTARACRVQVRPGMELVKLPKGGKWCAKK